MPCYVSDYQLFDNAENAWSSRTVRATPTPIANAQYPTKYPLMSPASTPNPRGSRRRTGLKNTAKNSRMAYSISKTSRISLGVKSNLEPDSTVESVLSHPRVVLVIEWPFAAISLGLKV